MSEIAKPLCLLMMLFLVLHSGPSDHVLIHGAYAAGSIEIRLAVRAPSLENGLLPNDVVQPAAIFLPSSYNISSKAYPVVYFLHGFQESIGNFEPIFVSMDLNETIVVLASGRNLLGGSFYANSPVTGNWEDFIVNDMVNFVDSNYRAMHDPAHRGIAGFSMGGYGALNIAMKHPDIFGSTFAISPGLFDRNGLSNSQLYLKSVIEYYLSTEEALSQLNRTAAHTEYLRIVGMASARRGGNEIFTFAYGSAFSPNPGKNAPYIDYPFSVDATGNIVSNQSILNSWENGFGGIDTKVGMYKENLRQLRGIGIECGARDEYRWIPQGCDYYSQELNSKGISHVMIRTSYGHGDALNERIRGEMMPFFLRVFSGETVGAATTPSATPVTSPQQQTGVVMNWLVIPLAGILAGVAGWGYLRQVRRKRRA
jgi:S-formylglutathione hydrolase